MINFYFLKEKRKIIIAAGAFLFILLIGLIIFFSLRDKNKLNQEPNSNPQNNLPAPEFLNVAEKDKFGLPADAKVQSLNKDEAGNILVYKIIYSDNDIIADPSAVAPISPRQKK